MTAQAVLTCRSSCGNKYVASVPRLQTSCQTNGTPAQASTHMKTTILGGQQFEMYTACRVLAATSSPFRSHRKALSKSVLRSFECETWNCHPTACGSPANRVVQALSTSSPIPWMFSLAHSMALPLLFAAAWKFSCPKHLVYLIKIGSALSPSVDQPCSFRH